MNLPDIAKALLEWYTLHGRDLPWRRNPTPYAVWVSEIMLQQTRVETVIPYFERWMKRFPTLTSLGEASLQEVLSTWEGLGYYSRARNLHRAAQIVLQDMNGQLPANIASLSKLPGIGRYTAGAIASIAFGLDEPALDANIRRVLSRLFHVAEPARSPAAERRLWELARASLPSGRAGDYNQAMMDLGAIVCLPRAPLCQECPLEHFCQARALGVQEALPVVPARPVVPHYIVTAAVIAQGDQVLITQRPEQGLLGGLWEFPGGKLRPGEDLAFCLQREIYEELGVQVNVLGRVGIYRHAYTHFRVTLHAFCCQMVDGDLPQALQVQNWRWVKLVELTDYPMGKIDRQISKHLMEQKACIC